MKATTNRPCSAFELEADELNGFSYFNTEPESYFLFVESWFSRHVYFVVFWGKKRNFGDLLAKCNLLPWLINIFPLVDFLSTRNFLKAILNFVDSDWCWVSVKLFIYLFIFWKNCACSHSCSYCARQVCNLAKIVVCAFFSCRFARARVASCAIFSELKLENTTSPCKKNSHMSVVATFWLFAFVGFLLVVFAWFYYMFDYFCCLYCKFDIK